MMDMAVAAQPVAVATDLWADDTGDRRLNQVGSDDQLTGSPALRSDAIVSGDEREDGVQVQDYVSNQG